MSPREGDTIHGGTLFTPTAVIRAENYTLLRGLVSPTLPKDKTFDELEAVLNAHFEPKALVTAEQFHFYRRDQGAEETIANFVAPLRKLAARCKFPDTFLNEALRDRLVCGLRDEATQKRLLSEADLTLDSAIQLAQSLGNRSRSSRSLRHSHYVT